jgi:hypothetical protein
MPDLRELQTTFETISTITDKLSETTLELVMEVKRLDEAQKQLARRVTAVEQTVYEQ